MALNAVVHRTDWRTMASFIDQMKADARGSTLALRPASNFFVTIFNNRLKVMAINSTLKAECTTDCSESARAPCRAPSFDFARDGIQRRSNLSNSMTFPQAATKSFANFSFASLDA